MSDVVDDTAVDADAVVDVEDDGGKAKKQDEDENIGGG